MKKAGHAKGYLLVLVLLFVCISCDQKTNKSKPKKPNILLLMSDNQSADHLGCYGDKSIKTPHIDKLAKKGLIFKNAYCSAPSCSPARASMLTGQDIWSLGEAANLWSSFPKVKVYTQLMEASGYYVGIEGKGWGPGDETVTGWEHNPGGLDTILLRNFLMRQKRDNHGCIGTVAEIHIDPIKKRGGKIRVSISIPFMFLPTYPIIQR